MKKYDHLLYKRGFLLTDWENVEFDNTITNEIVSQWKKIKFGKYQVLIEKSLSNAKHTVGNCSVLIFGLVLNPYKTENNIVNISISLTNKLSQNKDLFLDELDELSGRFTIIARDIEGNTEIYNDACGTRTVYYDTQSEYTIISSHSYLISDLMNYKTSEVAKEVLADNTFKGRKYLPGLLSPFDEIKPLTPNTSYNIEKREVNRFFPREDNKKFTLEEAADNLTNILRNQSKLLNEHNDTVASITAGLDSRLTLAVQNEQNTNTKYFVHYCSDNIDGFLEDMIIAEKITRYLGEDFSQFGYSNKDIPTDLSEYRYVWQRNIGMYRGSLKQFKMYTDNLYKNRIHIRSNVAEIGRVFYKDRGKEPTSEHLSTLFTKSEYGKTEFVINQFKDFIETTSFYESRFYNYNYADLFYWEHRMAMWHSWLVLESDTAFETFVPFNNRKFLQTMLAIPEKYRENDELMVAILKNVNPDLLKFPVNKKYLN